MAKLKVPQAASIGLDAAKLYEAIDHERQRRGMSLEEVAAELDASYATMACWRRGGSMRGDVLMRICFWMPIPDLRVYARHPEDPLPATQGQAA